MCNMLKCSCRLSLGSSGMLQILGVLANKIYFRMHPPPLGFPSPNQCYVLRLPAMQKIHSWLEVWKSDETHGPRDLMMIPFFLPAKNFQSSTMVIMIDHKHPIKPQGCIHHFIARVPTTRIMNTLISLMYDLFSISLQLLPFMYP